MGFNVPVSAHSEGGGGGIGGGKLDAYIPSCREKSAYAGGFRCGGGVGINSGRDRESAAGGKQTGSRGYGLVVRGIQRQSPGGINGVRGEGEGSSDDGRSAEVSGAESRGTAGSQIIDIRSEERRV